MVGIRSGERSTPSYSWECPPPTQLILININRHGHDYHDQPSYSWGRPPPRRQQSCPSRRRRCWAPAWPTQWGGPQWLCCTSNRSRRTCLPWPACPGVEEHISIWCLELERSTWATNMPMYKRKMMKLPLLGKFLANSSWKSILRQYRSIAWGTKFRKNVITNKILQTFEVLCEKRNDADNGVDENAHTLVTTEFMTSNSPIEKKTAISFAKFASCSSGKYMIVCCMCLYFLEICSTISSLERRQRRPLESCLGQQ